MAALAGRAGRLARASGWLAVAAALCAAACQTGDEWQIRKAVKRIVAGEADCQRAVDFVVGKGRRALPEIEQEMHAADPPARIRLIEAVRRIGDPEAVVLLRLLEKRVDDPAVRQAAIEAIEAIEALSARAAGR